MTYTFERLDHLDTDGETYVVKVESDVPCRLYS